MKQFKLQRDADNGQTHGASSSNNSDRSSTTLVPETAVDEWEQNRRRTDEFNVITIIAHGGIHENNLIIGYSMSVIIIIIIIFTVGQSGYSRREPIRHEKSDSKRIETITNRDNNNNCNIIIGLKMYI